MKIEHIAIWTKNIEQMRKFYEKYFNAKSNEKYKNVNTGFESYFLYFDDGCKLELMNMITIPDNKNDINNQYIGIIHFAFSVGNKEEVDRITKELINDGYQLLSGPRWTGDGYYESCFYDPENNRVEICI